MTVPVRYHCLRCETVHTLQRSASLADESVTPSPLEGWSSAGVDGDYEAADRVRLVCGESEADGEGCGERFYLNFVRFEDGRDVDPTPDSERVTIAPDRPAGPTEPHDRSGDAESAGRRALDHNM